MEQELNFTQGELKGELSIQLANDQTLNDFCKQHIAEFNPERFEAFAIRVFVGNETVITVYAQDKMHEDSTTIHEGKFGVKKFKITTLPLGELFSYCQSFNCTVSSGAYEMQDMEVVNK